MNTPEHRKFYNKKICYVATISHVVFSFLRGHINGAAKDFDVTIVCHEHDSHLLKDFPARFVPLEIQRKISPVDDLKILIKLFKLFKREKFSIVHSIMPKTGLLTMLAGWLAGVPVRIHTFTGQVWATRRGFAKRFLKLFDYLIVALATHVLTDSNSQAKFLEYEGVFKLGQGLVMGSGSICGIDPNQFKPDVSARQRIRTELEIPMEATVLLFLGRLNRDKGVDLLAAAFTDIAASGRDVYLIYAGAEEDVSYEEIKGIAKLQADRLRRIPFTSEPQSFIAAADIFCLPSFREGFGQVVIEAAACGIPAVSTRIYGITDAVADGETGLLVAPGSVEELKQALIKLIDVPACRIEMGNKAHERALKFFHEKLITSELLKFYDKAVGVGINQLSRKKS
ncbi:MAG: glycosyltransferase family 1 protein [Erysipelotrichia bacterium]|nr:glycosyltransferase family 1 protein [Erysipelotrichia bacterium]